MNIISENVILRAIEHEDIELLYDMINDPSIEKMTGGKPFPVSRDRQIRWFESYDQQNELRCMIQIKNGATIGMIMLTDIDYKNGTAQLHEKTKASIEDRRPNDVYNAMMGFINYAFTELRLNCLYGTVIESNLLSRKMALRCGLKEEGVLRQRLFKNGKYCNVIANSVLKEDFMPIYSKYLEGLNNE